MWGLLEHMLEVPTVGKDVHCSHTRGGQTVSRHRKGCQGATRLPNPGDGGIRVQRQQVCARTQSASAALCLGQEASVCSGQQSVQGLVACQSSENK